MYAIVFLALGCLLATTGLRWGGWYWLLTWPAVSFVLVGIAYAGVGPAVFGKRADGTMRPVCIVLLLPFLILLWGVWHIARLVSREAAYHEVGPGLLLGRRILPHELPKEVETVVDLTCEFPEPGGVARAVAQYVCLPTLDATAPDGEAARELLKNLRDRPGNIYVHCASGHGRSAMVVAAMLIARGQAADPAEALRLVRAARPGVRLQPRQWRLLEALASRAGESAAEPEKATAVASRATANRAAQDIPPRE